jgi:TusA-related sulfurtransferase
MSKRVALVLGTLFLSALFGASHEVAAATITVDDDGVQCPSPAFNTIQAAVNAASPGDTILVCAGTYSEAVNVNKTLTIRGAQFSVDARDPSRAAAVPPASESVVTGVGNNGVTPFNITANGVVVDGFTVQGASNVNQFGFAILIGAGTSGTQILNNVIQNNIAGISLANNSGTSQTVIRANLIRDNNVAGPVSGTGIYTDQFNAGGTLTNVLINNNTFSNDQNVAVLLGSTQSGSQSNVTVSNNIMDGNGNGVLAFNLSSSSVRRNTITNSAGSQVVVGGGVTGLSISENFIQNGATRGIRVGDFGGGSPNSGVTAICNSIENNPTAGLDNGDSPNYTGTLDARLVWWGSPTGPTIASNPGGTGEPIIDPDGEVVYQPFLTSGADVDVNAPGFQCSDAGPGRIIISEFRLQGTTTNDEFIELYNTTTSPVSLAGYRVEINAGSPPATINIPSGVIPAHGHFLLTHVNGYSLSAYATPDQTYTGDKTNNRGLRLVDANNTVVDAVGFTTSPADFKEGTGITPLAAATLGQFSYVRSQVTTGFPQDTDNNAADFLIVSTNPAATGGASKLGAPGPENTQSPITKTLSQIQPQLIDPTTSSTAPPNRVRDASSYTDTLTPSSPTGTTGTFPASTPNSAYALGTLSIQRRFFNNAPALPRRGHHDGTERAGSHRRREAADLERRDEGSGGRPAGRPA